MAAKSLYIEAITPNILEGNSARELHIQSSETDKSPEEHIYFNGSQIAFTFGEQKDDENLSLLSLTLSEELVTVEDKKESDIRNKENTHIRHEWKMNKSGNAISYIKTDINAGKIISATAESEEAHGTFADFKFNGVQLVSSKIDINALKHYPYHLISTGVYSETIGETERYLFGKKQEKFLQQVHKEKSQPLIKIWESFKKYQPQELVVLRPVKAFNKLKG